MLVGTARSNETMRVRLCVGSVGPRAAGGSGREFQIHIHDFTMLDRVWYTYSGHCYLLEDKDTYTLYLTYVSCGLSQNGFHDSLCGAAASADLCEH